MDEGKKVDNVKNVNSYFIYIGYCTLNKYYYNNTYLYSALFTLCSNALLKKTVIPLLNTHRYYTEKNESFKHFFEHCYGIIIIIIIIFV